MNDEQKLPVPPFTLQSATEKVRLAENAWNSRDPQTVALAYTVDSRWRNRDEWISGRKEIVEFLHAKWAREREYRLVKELWGFKENRMAVRFVYESQDAVGQWWRSFGNELWEFNPHGLMQRREASINDHMITEEERKFRWALGPRPEGSPGLTDLGL